MTLGFLSAAPVVLLGMFELRYFQKRIIVQAWPTKKLSHPSRRVADLDLLDTLSLSYEEFLTGERVTHRGSDTCRRTV